MSYFDHMSSCRGLDLENSKHFFSMTLILILMHHNIKFGDKKFAGLEDIIWKNINILTLRCGLDPECRNSSFFTGHSGL